MLHKVKSQYAFYFFDLLGKIDSFLTLSSNRLENIDFLASLVYQA